MKNSKREMKRRRKIKVILNGRLQHYNKIKYLIEK
jgi:hypothetical protein